MTAVAAWPTFSCSSSAASLVIEAGMVTDGETSIVTWVVVVPGFTVLMVPAIGWRAESFIREILSTLVRPAGQGPVQRGAVMARHRPCVQTGRMTAAILPE